ncbi:hypothetical protein D3C75_1184000 [compost metagenome]
MQEREDDSNGTYKGGCNQPQSGIQNGFFVHRGKTERHIYYCVRVDLSIGFDGACPASDARAGERQPGEQQRRPGGGLRAHRTAI